MGAKPKTEEAQATKTGTTTVFDKHAKEDSDKNSNNGGAEMSWVARIVIFLGFPTAMGFLGLYMAYLETIRNPGEREIDFDTDFIIPFLLALTMCIVIGFQTKGFKTKEIEPVVKWPKIRKKKVVKKVKRSELQGGQESEEEEDLKDETDKKDDWE